MFAANPWHFWIAVLLMGPVLLLLGFNVVRFLQKVVKPKYPGLDQDRG